MGKVNAFLQSNRACKVASDCVLVHTSCGTNGTCGAYIAHDREEALAPMSKELEDARCFAKGLVPCPSCPATPPPECVKGRCEASRK